MNIFDNGIRWVQATSFAFATALSLSDVIITRPYAHPSIAPVAICQLDEKKAPLDAAEDRAYWNAKYGRELSDAELLEIRVNCVRFIKALIAPAMQSKDTPTEARA